MAAADPPEIGTDRDRPRVGDLAGGILHIPHGTGADELRGNGTRSRIEPVSGTKTCLKKQIGVVKRILDHVHTGMSHFTSQRGQARPGQAQKIMTHEDTSRVIPHQLHLLTWPSIAFHRVAVPAVLAPDERPLLGSTTPSLGRGKIQHFTGQARCGFTSMSRELAARGQVLCSFAPFKHQPGKCNDASGEQPTLRQQLRAPHVANVLKPNHFLQRDVFQFDFGRFDVDPHCA